jgi:signal transduction histidine kinase/ActR/RegA family two-component response regulator
MSEVAHSNLLATALVDSAGKETYLAPFINGIRQVNGLPVALSFTDFEGKEIASNAAAHFTAQQLAWARAQLPLGRRAARVMTGPGGPELVAIEPLQYARTSSPEGAVIYKIALSAIDLEPGLRLAWGPPAAADEDQPATPVEAPAIFAPLQFRLLGQGEAGAGAARFAPQYGLLALLAAVVFIVVFLAGARLARLLTRDLSRLEAFSSRVTTVDGSGQRAPTTGSAEVASLAVSINRMLGRLHEQHDALRAEGAKLAELADALRAEDQRKDEFLAMLAHELRNPLAPISTGAELLRQAGGADPRIARTSAIIARQAAHMKRLVDDLLDVSRVTRGLVVLDRATLDLRGAVSAAVDQVQPTADRRGQAIDVDLGPGPLPVLGDAARLTQVVGNLLHNASKFSPAGARIHVSAHGEGDALVLRVADAGCGIGPELLPKVFDLFTQGSRDADRSQGGLGLGLALVKHLVELHGGSVRADSPGPGQGATFTVRLPRAAQDATRPPVAPQAGAQAQAKAQHLRILVVDDNRDAAESLGTLLELEGHAVTVLCDPLEALALAQRSDHDVYLLDIGLPGMDGAELARRLRALAGKQDALLVAITGYGQAADRARSSEAGFDHHLVKPVDPAALRDLLAQAREPARAREPAP